MACCSVFKSAALCLVYHQNLVAFALVVVATGLILGAFGMIFISYTWNLYAPAIVALFLLAISISYIGAVITASFWPAFAKRYVRIVAPLLRAAGVEGIPEITDGSDIQSRDWMLFDEPTVFLVHPGDDFASNDHFILCLVSLLCRRVNAWPKRQLVCLVPYAEPLYATLSGYIYKWIGCRFLSTTFRDDIYAAIEKQLASDCNVMVIVRGRCFRPVRGSTLVDDETLRDVFPMAVCASRHGARLVPCYVHDGRGDEHGRLRVSIGEPVEMERAVTATMPAPVVPRPPGPGPQMAIQFYFDALKAQMTAAESPSSVASIEMHRAASSTSKASAPSTVVRPS
jgi:hypothetical protein